MQAGRVCRIVTPDHQETLRRNDRSRWENEFSWPLRVIAQAKLIERLRNACDVHQLNIVWRSVAIDDAASVFRQNLIEPDVAWPRGYTGFQRQTESDGAAPNSNPVDFGCEQVCAAYQRVR